jgi:hypothetical protein
MARNFGMFAIRFVIFLILAIVVLAIKMSIRHALH